MTTALNSRKAIPVQIANFVLYCEEFKASAVRTVSEEPTVTGKNAVTKSFPRATRLTFSGRVCDETSSLDFVMKANNILHTKVKYDIAYRGIAFLNCTVQGFTAEDRGEGYIRATVTVVTADNIISLNNNVEEDSE